MNESMLESMVVSTQQNRVLTQNTYDEEFYMAYEVDFIGVGADVKKMQMPLLFDGKMKTIIIK